MHTTEPVELRGERILLAAPTMNDVDRIAELCRQPEIAAWTTIPSSYERSHAEGFVTVLVADGWASGRSRTWGVRDAPTGILLGMVGLDGIQDGTAEIGFWLDRAARGRGIMSEAVALVLDHAFAAQPDGVGLTRVEWRAFSGNAASAAVARRAGFQFEGVARRGGLQRGVRRDDWRAGLLASDPRTPAGDWPEFTSIQADR